MRGVDLWELPLDRALSVIYAAAMEGRDKKDRAKLQASFEQMTDQQVARAREDMFWNNEQDAAMFAAAERGLGSMFG